MEKIVMDASLRTKLIKLNPKVHTESDIYYDFNKLYKLFVNHLGYKKKSYIEYLKRKRQKIELLSGVQKLPNVVLPQEMIFDTDNNFIGLTMDYILNSKTLEDYFREDEINLFVKLLVNISLSLKKIHRRSEGFVIGDFTFSNILVDEDLLFYLIDFDNVSINSLKLPSERISPQIGDYSEFKGKRIKIDKNSDKLSFLLNFFECLFSKHFNDISLYDYDKKSEVLAILINFREVFNELKKEDDVIPIVPYFHEVINASVSNSFEQKRL